MVPHPCDSIRDLAYKITPKKGGGGVGWGKGGSHQIRCIYLQVCSFEEEGMMMHRAMVDMSWATWLRKISEKKKSINRCIVLRRTYAHSEYRTLLILVTMPTYHLSSDGIIRQWDPECAGNDCQQLILRVQKARQFMNRVKRQRRENRTRVHFLRIRPLNAQELHRPPLINVHVDPLHTLLSAGSFSNTLRADRHTRL